MIVLMAGYLTDLTTENLAIDLELSVGAVHPLPSHARYISTNIVMHSRRSLNFTQTYPFINVFVSRINCLNV